MQTQKAHTLELIVNGQPHTCAAPTTLAQLVSTLAPASGALVVERNGHIIAQEAWATCSLEAGDVLELIHFVGGG
ncbi:sulfur carrier protein ThiS [Desulfovibrio cuneatus]|uniref:sulfur carrier protein ThiS n=1 Tax=Desulfovibrio cuneatus TaxID=159728 RepID=UPI000409909F|nr:sulfur carrier protein ThiS [Desulfovibrio cuneatus]